MTPKIDIRVITKQPSLIIIFLVSFMLAYSNLSLASPPFALIDLSGKKNSGKQPTIQQKQVAKRLGEILWSDKTGGPRHIRGNLTQPSQDDPKTIAWRFLEEKKVLYGIKNPAKDLRIKRFISDKYDTTIHFQQMHKEIPVEAYLVVSILPNGVIHSVSGEYYPDLEIDIQPKVLLQKAKHIANQHGQKQDPTIMDLPDMADNSAVELLIRPSEDKDYLLWHFTGKGGWKYYIDAHDETIHNAISPIWYNFQPATGTTLATKDLPNGADVPFHLNPLVKLLTYLVIHLILGNII